MPYKISSKLLIAWITRIKLGEDEMLRRIASLSLTLILVVGVLSSMYVVQPVKAEGTIYIRADGSIDPPTAPISTLDNKTYSLTGNVTGSITIERDNIVLNGLGFTVFGDEMPAIVADGRKNLTLENTRISKGVYLNTNESKAIDNIAIGWSTVKGYGNSITHNTFQGYGMGCIGMELEGSRNTIYNNSIHPCPADADGLIVTGSSNNISYNTVRAGEGAAVAITGKNNTLCRNSLSGKFGGVRFSGSSSDNSLIGNVISSMWFTIDADHSNNNSIVGNNITGGNDIYPTFFFSNSFQNRIFHNNIVGYPPSVSILGGANVWDDGYPSGGNYWSDYNGTDFFSGPYQNETGCDGLGDTPYTINVNDTDHYPLMLPFSAHNIAVTDAKATRTIVAHGIIQKIDVSVANTGLFPESFSLTVYVNTTATQTLAVVLPARSSTVLRFYWDTAEAIYGNYAISASASIIAGEMNAADNNRTDGWVTVTIPGDVDGNFKVDIFDVVQITSRYGKIVPLVPPDSNSDIDGNGVVNIFDVVICTGHYGQKWP
jgi:hypothetical protein